MILLLLSCAPSVDSISENQQAKADFGGATLPAAPGNPRVPVLLQQPATTVIPDPNDAISRGFGPFAGGDFNGDGYADLAIGAVD
ncbi:MAG TPA: FG-GAP repeat protein, partial [Myxococcota bacterium]|nr:FG-GAP repeat protein [Myxococcota bacterium]